MVFDSSSRGQTLLRWKSGRRAATFAEVAGIKVRKYESHRRIQRAYSVGDEGWRGHVDEPAAVYTRMRKWNGGEERVDERKNDESALTQFA